MRLEAEQVPVKLQIAPVIGVRCRFLQVAHVLRDDGLPVLEQAKGGLQLGPHGEDGGRILEAGRQRERRWRVAPCAAQHARLARHNPRDAIVEPVHDIAVMHQEIIGDAGQPLAGFVIGDALRLVAAVARGEDDGAREVFHQEMMQRRVGQHEAERRLTGRDAGRQRGRMGARCLVLP